MTERRRRFLFVHAFSAFYELTEWRGDVRDIQRDMFLALLEVLSAQLLLGRLNDHSRQAAADMPREGGDR